MADTEPKTLRKMLADRDPVSWLAAADMIEEGGGDAAALRRRATLTLAIAGQIRRADAPGSLVRPRFHGRVADGVDLTATGGPKVLDACLSALGPLVAWATTGDHPIDPTQNVRQPLTFTIHLRRDLLARPDYLFRRAAELADEFLSPTSTWRAAVKEARGP